MKTEPAAIVGIITALVSALLVFAQSFGVNLSDPQQDAVRGLVAVVAPLVAALIIRSFVVSPETAQTKVEEGYASGQVGGPVPSVKT